MRRAISFLRALGLLCFGAFLASGLTALVTGILMVLESSGHGPGRDALGGDALGTTFVIALLATVIFGLFVSGIRSMSGILSDGERSSSDE